MSADSVVFENKFSSVGKGEPEILLGVISLPSGGNLRSDFDNLNLFQS